MKYFKFLTLLSCTLFAFLGAAQEKKWTLRECVDHALENNITVKQAQLDLKTANLEKLDAIGNLLPSLNVSSSVSQSRGLSVNVQTGVLENQTQTSLSAGISSGLRLFDGLKNIEQLNRAKLSKIAAQYKVDNIKDNIALNVVNYYLNVLFNKENLNVAKAQYAVTEQDLKKTKELVEAGVVPKGDVLEIEATAATQQQQIVNSENALQLSKIALAQLLLLENYNDFDVAAEDFTLPSTSILNTTAETIYSRALQFRNEIKLAETNVLLAEKDVKISKGGNYPTLDAFFNYNTRYADNDPRKFTEQLYTYDGISYGLSLNIPIFNGFSVRNNVKRSKINVERSKLQLTQDKQILQNTIYQAWNDTQAAIKSFEAAEKTLLARQEAYNYAKERFNVGLMNAFDFSQSQARVENAQAELIRTKFDYIFKLKVLEFYFGIPLDEL